MSTTAAHAITVLTTLAVFQAVLNASLISLILLLAIEPERVDRLRKWIGRAGKC
jgi:hypothetical protein